MPAGIPHQRGKEIYATLWSNTSADGTLAWTLMQAVSFCIRTLLNLKMLHLVWVPSLYTVFNIITHLLSMDAGVKYLRLLHQIIWRIWKFVISRVNCIKGCSCTTAGSNSKTSSAKCLEVVGAVNSFHSKHQHNKTRWHIYWAVREIAATLG